MQQQQPRRTSDAPVAPSKSSPHADLPVVKSEPIEIDLDQLHLVSGGDEVPPPAPKRFW